MKRYGEKPFLGVCVALQVVFEASEESPGVEGLGSYAGEGGAFRGRWVRFRISVGTSCLWCGATPSSEISTAKRSTSYILTTPEPEETGDLIGETDYGARFCAAAGRENLVAVQFHREEQPSRSEAVRELPVVGGGLGRWPNERGHPVTISFEVPGSGCVRWRRWIFHATKSCSPTPRSTCSTAGWAYRIT